MPSVQLIQGDLFDGPADMITLPCSTAGTVAPVVERRLNQFALPHPGRMDLGSVVVRPLDDAEQIAQYVAFAASVADYTSSASAIAHIAEDLGKATCELNAVGSVSAPLLGAGAGGLSPQTVVKSLRDGFLRCAAPSAVLSIFVLESEDYAALASEFRQETAEGDERLAPSPGVRRRRARALATTATPSPPRVFVSHSSLNSARKAWLIELHKYLRQNGIDSRLDEFALRPGMDLVQWMCNELAQADRVLLICDERYADRADGRHGGVGWETMLIQGDLYATMYGDQAQEADSGSKYIPIVLTSGVDEGRPTYLKTKLVIHWPDDADEEQRRQELVREIFGASAEEEPIGERPPWA